MKVYLDTSSLLKLYHTEEGTRELDRLFNDYFITGIFLSEIAKVEFFSAVYKKMRTKEFDASKVDSITSAFNADAIRYTFVPINPELISSALSLVEKYGSKGLRTLDAIRLASACKVSNQVGLAVSDDKLLNLFLTEEGLKIL